MNSLLIPIAPFQLQARPRGAVPQFRVLGRQRRRLSLVI